MVRGLGFTTLALMLFRFRMSHSAVKFIADNGYTEENLAWCDVAALRLVGWCASLVQSCGYPLSLSFFVAASTDSLRPQIHCVHRFTASTDSLRPQIHCVHRFTASTDSLRPSNVLFLTACLNLFLTIARFIDVE